MKQPVLTVTINGKEYIYPIVSLHWINSTDKPDVIEIIALGDKYFFNHVSENIYKNSAGNLIGIITY